MASKPILRIPKWRDFQHYKDRRPVWIKAHTELLLDDEWHELADASKAHLFGLWLLAASYDGKIPFKPTWITKQIGAGDAIDWRELASSKWVALNASASDLLADAYQDDSLRALAREEAEQEEEVEKEPQTARATQRRIRKPVTHMTPDWQPTREVISEMQAECLGVDVAMAVPEFRDYWIGRGEGKADWDATFRNRIRALYERRNGNGRGRATAGATNRSERLHAGGAGARPPSDGAGQKRAEVRGFGDSQRSAADVLAERKVHPVPGVGTTGDVPVPKVR